jgi:transcription factor WhiB
VSYKGRILPLEQAWENEAACRHHDPSLWDDTPVRHDRKSHRDRSEAIRICHEECPVPAQCLALALSIARNDPGSLSGIWAGLTVEEILKLAGKRKRRHS